MTDIHDTNTTPEGTDRAKRGRGKRKPPNSRTAANGHAGGTAENGAMGTGATGNGATSFAPGMSEEAVVAAIVCRIESIGEPVDTLIAEALAAGAIDMEAAMRIPFIHRQAFDEARARAASNGAPRMDPTERAYWTLLGIVRGDGIDPKQGDFIEVVKNLFDKAIDTGLTGDQLENIAAAIRGKVKGQDNKRVFERVYTRARERHAAKHLAAELERLKAKPIDYTDCDGAELLIAAKELAKRRSASRRADTRDHGARRRARHRRARPRTPDRRLHGRAGQTRQPPRAEDRVERPAGGMGQESGRTRGGAGRRPVQPRKRPPAKPGRPSCGRR